jgi:hypothetical protein
MGWMLAIGSLALLVFSAGLLLYAQQAHGAKAGAGPVLGALYLAAWTYAVGLTGLAAFSAWWAIDRWLAPAARRSSTESRAPATRIRPAGIQAQPQVVHIDGDEALPEALVRPNVRDVRGAA